LKQNTEKQTCDLQRKENNKVLNEIEKATIELNKIKAKQNSKLEIYQDQLMYQQTWKEMARDKFE